MIPTFEHAALQAQGAWFMAEGRPNWRNALATSADDLSQSFYALVYAAPFGIVGYDGFRRLTDASPRAPRGPLAEASHEFFIVASVAIHAAQWLAGAALLYALVRGLDVREKMATILVGYNWAQFLSVVAWSAPFAASTLALEGFGARWLALIATALIAPISLVLQLTLAWGVLRRGFEKSFGDTLTILAMLLLAGVAAQSIGAGLAGALAA